MMMAASTELHTHFERFRQKFHLIWLSENIEELKRQHSESFASLQRINNSFDCFTDSELCMNFIFENTKNMNILIVDNTLVEDIVEIIHDTEHLYSIFIFCHNTTYQKQWTEQWMKIKGIFTKMDQLCQKIKEIYQSDTVRSRSISHIDVSDRTTTLIDHSHSDTNSPLVNSLRRPSRTVNSLFSFNEFERTLIATAEQELRKSLLVNGDQLHRTSINTNTIDHLQHTLVPIIEKYVTQDKTDSHVLNHLFADLKQVLVDTIVQQQQQQSVLSQEIVRQTVLNILNEQNKLGVNPTDRTTTTTTTTKLNINQRKPITLATIVDVKISADLRRTRVDGAFRRERDAVVANKNLRNAVQQWTSINSIVNLITMIRTHGKNNLECAWLLFCWIGTNIRYQASCNNNSAESVFRTRVGVCRGFVSLYHQCCSLLNIECLEIFGYVRQAFLKSNEQ